MDGIQLIQDLAVVLLGAGIAGVLCKRIGLSVIVGYLLAGVAIGPHTPPFSFILDVERIETLAQVGLVFLMFAIGLGLSLTKLQKMGLASVMATALGAFFVFNFTQLLGKAIGWSPSQTLFVAAMLMVSSSAVIAKVIKDMNLSHERSGQQALGVTVLEDVVAVVMLAILGAQIATSGTEAGVGSLLTGLTTFVVLVVLAGLLLLPRLLRRLSAKADPELQTIVVAGLLFLMALLAVKAGYSLALGAFLLGAIVADMPQKSGVEKAFTGMRDMFSSVFFVAIGMMIDVSLMLTVWPWVLGLGLFTLVVRAVSTGFALMVVGTPPHEARRAGLLLTPLGEFTFVIAQLGVAAKVLGPEMYPIAVGVSLFTVLVSPLINRHAEPVLQLINRAEPRYLRRFLEAYHHWLVQLGNNTPKGGVWWRLGKKRVAHIALETLFITGVLIFSERLFLALQQSFVARSMTPGMLTLVFWLLVGILVLVPLVAIWMNLSVLAKDLAQATGARPRFLAPIVENGFKIVSVLAIAHWLFYILPTESLSQWAWLGIAWILSVGLVVFSRRLLYWHGAWKSSLDDAFSENPDADGSRQKWLVGSSDWEIQAQDLLLPERAACSGKSIADLRVRSQFGCSIVEISRGGHTILSPDPTQMLYSGDRLLLLGTPTQIAAARQGLEQVQGDDDVADFEDAGLETVIVPPGPRVGLSLAELQVLRQTGVLVAGIRREGEKIINPVGTDRLAEGDELLLLGSPRQIRNFKGWLLYLCTDSQGSQEQQVPPEIRQAGQSSP